MCEINRKIRKLQIGRTCRSLSSTLLFNPGHFGFYFRYAQTWKDLETTRVQSPSSKCARRNANFESVHQLPPTASCLPNLKWVTATGSAPISGNFYVKELKYLHYFFMFLLLFLFQMRQCEFCPTYFLQPLWKRWEHALCHVSPLLRTTLCWYCNRFSSPFLCQKRFENFSKLFIIPYFL